METDKTILKAKIEKKIDFEKRFKREIVILKNKKLYKLNEEGTIIWKFLGEIPTEEICKKIATLKKQKIDKVESDIVKFLNELLDLGLISICQEGKIK